MIRISRDLMLAKLNNAFPDPKVAEQALVALDRFEGPCREGVQLAIIKLSSGQLWKLRELVKAARKDFRDVLYPAQAPELFATISVYRDPETRFGGWLPKKKLPNKKKMAAREKRDHKQWIDWLLS